MTGISAEIEMLARMWIECDPNRSLGAEPGSGFHPDDIIGPRYTGSSDGESQRLPDTDLTGKPNWHWFVPRAEATQRYLAERGFAIGPKS